MAATTAGSASTALTTCEPCTRKSAGAGAGAGLSEYTKSVMNKPMSQWFFGDLATRGETGARVAGKEEVPLGQVPKSAEGRQKDMEQLNEYIRETYQMAVKKGLVPRSQPPPRELGSQDVKIIISEFYLGADTRCTAIDQDNLTTLLPPPHLANMARRKSDSRTADDSMDNVLAGGHAGDHGSSKKTKGGAAWPGLVQSTSPICLTIQRNLEDRRIYLRVYDLLTAFPDRWLDSVVIDAYIHLLQEHCQFKDSLYVVSAESDPALAEIARTPSCYKYIVCPLFHKSHWVMLVISHPTKRIRYLNSQVVDKATPEFQTRPFTELFPGYKITRETSSIQCDQSSCGVLTSLWACIFLFYNEEEMDKIKCKAIDPFRMTMLQQLILSYILLNKSLPSSSRYSAAAAGGSSAN